MKYLPLIFLFLSLHSYAQTTGNPHVRDSSAIGLSSEVISSLQGKWKLIRAVESFHDQEQSWDIGIIANFDKDGTITTSWCVDCPQEKAGKWEVLNKQSIKFTDSGTEGDRYLAGDWAVYKLTGDEMVLAKVLTSSGDWRKFQYFSRNTVNPPITDVDCYCVNCSLNSSSCFGDRPDEAKRRWAILNDLVNSGGYLHGHSSEILERYDWLLRNAPCISESLYVNAVRYYESLLTAEEDKQTIKSYQEKIKLIVEQQQLYSKKQ